MFFHLFPKPLIIPDDWSPSNFHSVQTTCNLIVSLMPIVPIPEPQSSSTSSHFNLLMNGHSTGISWDRPMASGGTYCCWLWPHKGFCSGVHVYPGSRIHGLSCLLESASSPTFLAAYAAWHCQGKTCGWCTQQCFWWSRQWYSQLCPLPSTIMEGVYRWCTYSED